MGNVEIKLDSEGIQELLKSDEIMDVLRGQAKKALSGLNSGYAMSEYKGKTRGNVSIYANTKEAYKDNLENNTLLKVAGK